MSQNGYLFLTGADMHPSRVRATWPGARFVARAATHPDASGDIASPFAALAGETLWGILIATDHSEASRIEVRTDDGRSFTATANTPFLAGEPKATLAAVRYWELPPDYVARLMAILDAAEEDPRDDAQTG